MLSICPYQSSHGCSGGSVQVCYPSLQSEYGPDRRTLSLYMPCQSHRTLTYCRNMGIFRSHIHSSVDEMEWLESIGGSRSITPPICRIALLSRKKLVDQHVATVH